MKRACFSLGLLIGGFWPVIAHSIPLSKADIDSTLARLRSESLSLRAALNTSQTSFVETPEGEAFFVHDGSNMFRLRQPISITVDRLAGDASLVELKVRSQRHGAGAVKIFPPFGRELTPEDLNLVLRELAAPAETLRALPAIIGNRESHIAHVRTSNHLPPPADRVALASIEEAQAGGYELCPVCFWVVPAITGYSLERRLGDEVAARFRYYNPIVANDSLNSRVERIGRQVLGHWPVSLRGYDYRFFVVDNAEPNAVACPAGRIFVTSGLLRAAESDAEIEGVLAHEIAHVERRHGYAQYVSARNGATIAAAIGLGAAILSGKSEVAKVTVLLAQLAVAIALSGYSRDHESEADSYALAYMTAHSAARSPTPFTNMLSKLKYRDATEGLAGLTTGALSSHPGIDERILKANGATVALFPAGSDFAGYDRDGNQLVKVRLEAQAHFEFLKDPYDPRPEVDEPGVWERTKSDRRAGVNRHPRVTNEVQLFATLESTADLPEPVTVGSVGVSSGKEHYTLMNAAQTELGPLESIGVNFVLAGADRLLPVDVLIENMSIPGVVKWAPVGR